MRHIPVTFNMSYNSCAADPDIHLYIGPLPAVLIIQHTCTFRLTTRLFKRKDALSMSGHPNNNECHLTGRAGNRDI